MIFPAAASKIEKPLRSKFDDETEDEVDNERDEMDNQMKWHGPA